MVEAINTHMLKEWTVASSVTVLLEVDRQIQIQAAKLHDITKTNLEINAPFQRGKKVRT